jgi:ABC-type transporter Mla maintaining outer membrane lipid asymmetry permease subunit MlaE
MPYFVNLEHLQVIVRPPGATVGDGEVELFQRIAEQAGLRTGQLLTAEQLEALRRRSIADYRAAGGDVPTTPVAAPRPVVPRRSSREHAHHIASIVEVLAWALMVIGILVGLVVMLQVRDTFDEFGVGDERPYVGEGLMLVVGSVFNCLLVVMVAAYIKYRTDPAPAEG